MAYNIRLAERIQKETGQLPEIETKAMFGGICYLVHGNMACGVYKENLIVRVGADQYRHCLQLPYVKEFNITGRSMTGWIMVEPPGVDSAVDLSHWIQMGLQFASTLPAKTKNKDKNGI